MSICLLPCSIIIHFRHSCRLLLPTPGLREFHWRALEVSGQIAGKSAQGERQSGETRSRARRVEGDLERARAFGSVRTCTRDPNGPGKDPLGFRDGQSLLHVHCHLASRRPSSLVSSLSTPNVISTGPSVGCHRKPRIINNRHENEANSCQNWCACVSLVGAPHATKVAARSASSQPTTSQQPAPRSTTKKHFTSQLPCQQTRPPDRSESSFAHFTFELSLSLPLSISFHFTYPIKLHHTESSQF